MLKRELDPTNPAHAALIKKNVKALAEPSSPIRLFYLLIYDQNGVESKRELLATFDLALKRFKEMPEHLPPGCWCVMLDFAGRSSFLYYKGIA